MDHFIQIQTVGIIVPTCCTVSFVPDIDFTKDFPVDQPYGTGFSQVTGDAQGPLNEYEVGAQFVSFLNGFYRVFPAAASYNLYLAGESYAGMYIPYISAAILNCPDLIGIEPRYGSPIPLRGIILGASLVSFDVQASPSITTQTNLELLTAAHVFDDGVNFGIDADAFRNGATTLARECSGITSWEFAANNTYGCDMVAYAADFVAAALNYSACFDYYKVDTLMPCTARDHFWAAEDALATYLNVRTDFLFVSSFDPLSKQTPEVRTALHVDPLLVETLPNAIWQECTTISVSAQADMMYPSSVTLLPQLIDAGIRILMYSGDLDLVMDYFGIELVLSNLTWAGSTGFQQNPTNWIIDGDVAGLYWCERGLKYIRAHNAGHMVPADQPSSGIEILNEILTYECNC
ncbi:Cell death protease [Entophlyctis sp. JEL0112]|nr:Cell death protease [Entophlyctis sp. JEL0112]